jgi:hypothetical protein
MIILIRSSRWESKLTPFLKKTATSGGKTLCRVMVELSGQDYGPVKTMIANHEGVVCKEIHSLGMLVAEIPLSTLSQLANLDQVKKIREDATVKVMDRSELGE